MHPSKRWRKYFLTAGHYCRMLFRASLLQRNFPWFLVIVDCGRITSNAEVSWNRSEMSVQPTIRPRHRRTVTTGTPLGWKSGGRVYPRRFVSTRLAATLLADGAPCFVFRACPALVFKRDCSYISIHFSLEIDEISLPIASSGKSSGDWK